MTKENKLIAIPTALIEEVEKFQKENYIVSFTAAIIELLRRGLKFKE